MKRASVITLVALLVFVSVFGLAAAAPIGPTADTYVESTAPSVNYGSQTYLGLYTNGAGCATQDYIFLRFDLSNITRTIGSATLSLTTAFPPSSVVAGQTKVSLFPVADNTWTELGLTYSNAPALGAELLPAVDAPTAANSTIIFGSSSGSSPLATYLDGLKGGSANLAVKLTGTCNSVTTGVFLVAKGGPRPSLLLVSPCTQPQQ